MNNYSLIKRLLLIQGVTILLGLGLFYVVFISILETKIAAEISKLRDRVELALDSKQDEWRAWDYFGLASALVEALAEFRELYPLEELRVVERKELPKDLNKNVDIIIPKNQDEIIDNVIYAKISIHKIQNQYAFNNIAIALLLIFGVLFIASMLLSFFFIREKIYKPISELNSTLQNLPNDRTLEIENIKAEGEIKDFINAFARMYKENKEAEHFKSIVQTTQMLAHDVRKPFALLKSGLHILGFADKKEDIALMKTKLTAEVETAMISIDGMLSDIMDAGTEMNLAQKAVSPNSLIGITINDVFKLKRNTEIAFSYQFAHQQDVNVDSEKIGRALSNILENAIQAMGKKGEIWFHTTEIAKEKSIEFIIGNSKTYISLEDRDRVFTIFYTKGKKRGTGLGLAIAKKIVVAHKGRIWCTSSKTNGTEFHVRLPAIKKITDEKPIELPAYSKEVRPFINQYLPQQSHHLWIKENELNINRITQYAKELRRRIKILMIDDEPFYFDVIQSQLVAYEQVEDAIEFLTANSSDRAIEIVEKQKPDVILCDIDMGADSLDGFETVDKLRRLESKAQICIHSSRNLSQDYKRSMDVGANAFLPKPITDSHLLMLIVSAIPKAAKPKNQK